MAQRRARLTAGDKVVVEMDWCTFLLRDMALERDVDGVKECLKGVRMQGVLKATGSTYHTVHLPASEELELSAPVAAVHPWDGASAPPLFVCVENRVKEGPGMVLPGDYVHRKG